MAELERPEIDLRIVESKGGLTVAQAGRTYLARRWQLTSEVLRIIDLACDHGLTCLWQKGHPQGSTSPHISFSYGRSAASWVFVLGREAGPPNVSRVTFSRKTKPELIRIGRPWTWENGGGKNIFVDPGELDAVLRDADSGRLRTLCEAASTSDRVSVPDLISLERDLELALTEALSRDLDIIRMDVQRRFAPNADAPGGFTRDIPDVIVFSQAYPPLVVELKLHQADEADVAQARRYANNRALIAWAEHAVRGVLVAGDFAQKAIQMSNEAEISLYRYLGGSDDLRLEYVSGETIPCLDRIGRTSD